MEWHAAPAGWSVCLPLLIFPCTIKSRSCLLALAHPGGPGKRAVKRLCVCVCVCVLYESQENNLEIRLQNDLSYPKLDAKPYLTHSLDSRKLDMLKSCLNA